MGTRSWTRFARLAGALACALTLAVPAPHAAATTTSAAATTTMPDGIRGGPYWPMWDIATGVATFADGTGGYVLDGWGGLHPFAVGDNPIPPLTRGGPYWPGWSIARGVALLPSGTGGYVLDGWGGLHPFAVGDNPLPPYATTSPYWPMWDIARGVALLPNGTSGYTVDGWGGFHPVAFGGAPAPTARQTGVPYWVGVDRADDIALLPDGTGGYVLDGYGNMWDFGLDANRPPGRPVTRASWGTWDIARGVAFLPNETAFTLDGWGGVHGASQPSLASNSYSYLVTHIDGTPYRYNPCAPIHYVINPAGAPWGAVADVHAAFARLANATGIAFTYDGTTSESPTTARASYQPERYGARWAPVSVSWDNPWHVPELSGATVGIGGSSARAVDGVAQFVSGVVILDSAQLQPYRSGFGLGYTQGELILHELGHVLGLGHTGDANQIMYETMTSYVAELGLGDRAGLAKVGRDQGCLPVPPLPGMSPGAQLGGDTVYVTD